MKATGKASKAKIKKVMEVVERGRGRPAFDNPKYTKSVRLTEATIQKFINVALERSKTAGRIVRDTEVMSEFLENAKV